MSGKKKDTLWEDDIVKCCANCEKASVLKGTDYIVCEKHGVVNAAFCCKKYIYDPLKRIPHSPLSVSFESEETENDTNDGSNEE